MVLLSSILYSLILSKTHIHTHTVKLLILKMCPERIFNLSLKLKRQLLVISKKHFVKTIKQSKNVYI